MTTANELLGHITKTVVKRLLCAIACPMERRPPTEDPNYSFGVPMVFEGAPGVGKSMTVHALGMSLEIPYANMNMGRTLLEELTGIPAIINGELAYNCPNKDLAKIAQAQEGLVFLDEINMADAQAQKPLQAGLSDKRLGGLQLPKRTRMLAVKNPPGLATDPHEFSAPVANRFVHVKWESPTVEEFYAYLDNRDENEVLPKIAELEGLVIQEWSKHYPAVASSVRGFHKAQPNMLNALPEEGSELLSAAWPSNRTWFMAIQLMTTCRCLGFDKQIEIDLLYGCVGEGAGKSFVEWVRTADLPSVHDVLANGFEPDTVRLDRSVAVYNALAKHCVLAPKGSPSQHKERNRVATIAWEVLRRAQLAGQQDLIAEACHQLLDGELGVNGVKITDPHGAELTKAFDQVLRQPEMTKILHRKQK